MNPADRHHCAIVDRWRAARKGAAVAEHVLAPVISPRDLCVANREAGQPGAYTYDTIDWSIATGNGYTGAYQFLDSTWQEAQQAMGLATEVAPGKWTYAYGAEAWEATPTQQTAVFDFWAAKYGSQPWPNTGPPCGL